jgi:hypothetical protein
VPKISVACCGPNHSFLIFSSRPYLLLLPKLKAIGTSHSSPSLSFSVPPLRGPDHGRQRGQHRVFHGGASVADGILVVYRDKHQHHPHGKAKGNASALMSRHLLPEPVLEPPRTACTEPEPELPVSTPGERLVCFFSSSIGTTDGSPLTVPPSPREQVPVLPRGKAQLSEPSESSSVWCPRRGT